MTVSFATHKLIENANMGSSFESNTIPLPRRSGYAIHAVFTGSPVGSLYVSVSIDGVNWSVLKDSPQSIAEAGDIFFNVRETNYLYAKLNYDFTSGTGVLNAFYSAKEIA